MPQILSLNKEYIMKKKLLGLLLALSMLLGLSACGGNDLSVSIIGGNDGPTDLIISDGSAYDGADYTDTTDNNPIAVFFESWNCTFFSFAIFAFFARFFELFFVCLATSS